VWKKEKSIQKIKAEQNITYLEAKKSFEMSATRLPGTSSYAQAVATPIQKITLGTQTDLCWPKGYRHPETTKFIQDKQLSSTSSRVNQNDEIRKSPPRRPSGRLPKGVNDPIKQSNRYSSLEDLDDDATIPAKPKSGSGTKSTKNNEKQTKIKQHKIDNRKADVEPMELASPPDGEDVDELDSVEPETNPRPPNPKKTSATRQRITPP
jgi:hypothetical protein